MSAQDPPKGPPPLKPGNVLDSMLSDHGPMPTARLSIRALALCFDLALIFGVSALILKATLLDNFPNAPEIWANHNLGMQNADYMKNMILNMKATNPELFEIIAEALSNTIAVAWFYFAAGEAFFGGSSIGKSCCRLRSINTIMLDRPSFFGGIVRGGIKTIMLLGFGIIGWAGILIPLLFNKRRQLGHDLLSRTAVIDERYLNTSEKSPSEFNHSN